MDRQEFDANYEEMVAYFRRLGFDNVNFQAKDSATGFFTETRCTFEGVYVEINPAARQVQLSVIDGLITCSTGVLGFPNRLIPRLLKQLRRHIPEE